MLLFLTSLLQRDCIRTITSGGKRAKEGHNMAITHNQNSDDKKFIFHGGFPAAETSATLPTIFKSKTRLLRHFTKFSSSYNFFFVLFSCFQSLVSCLHLLSCHLSNWLTSILGPLFFTYLKKGLCFRNVSPF